MKRKFNYYGSIKSKLYGARIIMLVHWNASGICNSVALAIIQLNET